MSEQKLIRKQLIKNMFYTFIVFAVILIFFDAIIYNQVSVSLYKSIDEELLKTVEVYENREVEKEIKKNPPKEFTAGNQITFIETKINPRLICIIRSVEGDILNSENIGRFYDDYINDIKFDETSTDKIYAIKVQDTYNYRGITLKSTALEGQEVYIQLLANVDGEVETINTMVHTLLLGSLIIIVIAIISSYILSKMTLKPIMDSYKKQTEFVQNAAHELRTPLTIIQAKQELLLQEPDSKILEKSEDINIMLKETKRLTKLIKELMVLAMADSNELKMKKEKTNIDTLIKEICIPYTDFAEMQDKQIIMDLKYDKKINIDPNKISQLMVIVLDNAIKYTSESDKIEIKTYSKEGKCVIEVSDTGIGISKEAAKHVFDRFYREDKARSREKGGTGLRTFNSTYDCKLTRWKYKNNAKRAKRSKSNNKNLKFWGKRGLTPFSPKFSFFDKISQKVYYKMLYTKVLQFLQYYILF